MPTQNPAQVALGTFDGAALAGSTLFDDIVSLAAQICAAPIAVLGLIEGRGGWRIAKVGLADRAEAKAVSFCIAAMSHPDGLVVADVRIDERFATLPLVTDPPCVRFYASVPVIARDGTAIGALCVLDPNQRTLGDGQLEGLKALARQAAGHLDSQRKLAADVKSDSTDDSGYRQIIENFVDPVAVNSASDGRYLAVNREFLRASGYSKDEVIGKTTRERGLLAHPDDWGKIREELKANGMVRSLELDFRMKNGEIIPALYSAFVGKFEGQSAVISFTRDIRERKRAEAELRASEAKFRQMFEGCVDAVAINDFETGRYIEVNDEFVRVTGRARKDVIGKAPPEIGIYTGPRPGEAIRPHESGGARQQSFGAILRRLAERGRVRSEEVEFWDEEGRVSPMLFSAFVTELDGRKVVISFTRDIARLKRAEAEVRASEAKFRRMIEGCVDPVTVNAGDDGRYLEVNSEFIRITGYAPEEVIGKTPHELGIFANPQDEVRVATELAAHGFIRNIEMDFRVKDGRVVPSLFSAFIGEVSGEPVIISFTRDNALQKSVMEQMRSLNSTLQNQTALVQSILQSMGDGILVLDAHRRPLRINEAGRRLLGFDPTERAGAKLMARAVILKADGKTPAGRENGPVQRALRGEQVDGSEVCVRYPHRAEPVWMSITSRRLEGNDGAMQGAVVTFHDIGERKRFEAELVHARDLALETARLKSEFLANMSHEIRTPMNAVIGMTRLLLDTKLNEAQREYAETARSSGEALLELINNVLDFSKIQAGRLMLEQIDFDLGALAESTVEALAEQAQRKGLELAAQLDAEVPTLLRGDPGRLRQIVTNLLGNAIKFTEHGEVVLRVGCEAKGGDEATIRFTIRDTGIGIAADAQHRLFQPFTQADGSTTRKFGGTGLGLAISAQLAEAMGGTIGLESEAGVGSTFFFTARFARQNAIALVNDTAEARSLDGVRVLIAEHGATTARILQEILDSWRMRSEIVSGGAQALAALRKAAADSDLFEVALLDMQMAEMDGLALPSAIGADAALRSTAVIVMYPLGLRPDEAEMKAAGVRAWLAKPVKQSLLFDALATIAHRRVHAIAEPIPAKPRPAAARSTGLSEQVRRSARILLVEDHLINRKVAMRMLERYGFRADVAGNGIEALEATGKTLYDVVLMDCQMPEMDGYKATRAIREREGGHCHTAIIGLTANALQGDRERCLEAGMDDYLSKPVKPEDLAATVDRWVAPALHLEPQNEGAAIEDRPDSIDKNALAALREGQAANEPAFFVELIDLFVADLPQRVAAVREAIERGDAKTLRLSAHTLKGSCSHFGAKRLFALSADLESRGREGIVEGAAALLHDLEGEAARVRIALEAEKRNALTATAA